MVKKLILFLLSILFLGNIFLGNSRTAYAFSGTGGGTSGNPYQITTCAQLLEMSNNLSAYYVQKNDINCTGVTYTAVGTSGSEFTGTFDGGNYAISQLTITGSGGGNGLFGYVNGATIKNVRLTSGSITDSGSYVGSLIGHAGTGTTVLHSSSEMTVSGGGFTGGLIGYVTDSIRLETSFYNGSISTGDNSGGLIGSIYGTGNTVSNCYSAGTFSAANKSNVGGLIGYAYTSGVVDVTNCYSAISMSIGGATNVGGFIGVDFTGTVNYSFAASPVVGSGTNHGGGFGGGYTTTNNFYLDVYTATSGCLGAGDSVCINVNSGNSQPNYFKGNNTNPPMSNWDFVNTWETVANGYPRLRNFSSPVRSSQSVSTGSSSIPSCTNEKPASAPNLFQVNSQGNTATIYFVPVTGQNTKYIVNYGVNNDASGFGVEFNYLDRSGVIPYSINSLFPGTWYFKVRGSNGCMPGDWSQILSVKVGFGALANNMAIPVNKSATGSLTNKCGEYTVQAGDSLWKIAQSKLGNGSKYQSIVSSNNLPSINLSVGQRLKVGCSS